VLLRDLYPGCPSLDLQICDLYLNPVHSRPGIGFYVALNRLAQFKPCLGQVVHLLEVEPELRSVAEELCQAQRRVWR